VQRAIGWPNLRRVRVPADHELSVFEERAENLSDEEFARFTAPTPHDKYVLRQLVSKGPKLLSGPRGCGKSTFLRIANDQIISKGVGLPVYVNYGKSMFIEPAFKQRSDADVFFLDWLVARVLDAAERTLRERFDYRDQALTDLGERAREFISQAEMDPGADRAAFPGPTALAALLEKLADSANCPRVVLLMDDAAHAFVPEQQRIFFEFLRNLRTPTVTFKAAIYPGVTEFSPNFHVGHDAKMVPAWTTVEGGPYLTFMRDMLTRRLPAEELAKLPAGLIDLFAAASFGIPRTYFAMVEAFLESPPTQPGQIARAGQTTITETSDQLRLLHRSLAAKLPRFRQYVEIGEKVLDNIVSEIRTLNEDRSRRDSNNSAVDIAVRHPIDPRLGTIFGLLEYAGLVRRTNESISLGSQGTYTKFAVHGAILVAGGAVTFGKNPTLEQRAQALLRATRTGSFKRTSGDNLLTPELAEACTLVVANCGQCGAARLSEDAKFCSNCGAELVDASRFEELLQAPVDLLPIPPRKRQALNDANLRRVEDILRDRGLAEIRKAQRVGPVWARRIYATTEEFVGV
jgi:hypothetical protein